MAEYIKQEDYDALPEEEKKSMKISALKGLEALLMIVEFFAMCGYAYYVVHSRFTGEGIASDISRFILIATLAGMSYLLVAIQKVLFYEMVKAFQTKSIRDDALTIVGFVLVTAAICLLDWKGGEMFLKSTRGYVKQEKTVGNDDSHLNASKRKESNSQREATAREKAEKDLDNCVQCEAIKARYATKIKPHQRSSNPAWVKSINKNIDRQNEAVRAERDAAVAEARAKIASDNDIIISAIVGEVSSADKQVGAASALVTIHNEDEERKRKDRELQNETFALLVTPITQPLLILFRIMLIVLYRKMNYTVHQSAGLLKLSGIFGAIIRPVSVFVEEAIERLELFRISAEIKSVERMEEKKQEVASSHGAQFRQAFNSNQPLGRAVLKMIASGQHTSSADTTSPIDEEYDESLSFSDDTPTDEGLIEEELIEDSSKIIDEKDEIIPESDGNLQDLELIDDFVEKLTRLSGICEPNDIGLVMELIRYLKNLKNSL